MSFSGPVKILYDLLFRRTPTKIVLAEDPEKTLPEVQVLLESDSKDNGRHMAETNHPTSVAGTKVC